MSGHDATSVIGQMAGLDAEKQKPEPLPPRKLIRRFCTGPEHRGKTTVYRGHCGYIGGRGDSLLTGFDDGYDWMGYLTDRGWGMLPAKGDWPYVVYLRWVRDGVIAIAEYLEGDFTVWVFDDSDAAKALYAGLGDCP